MGNAASSILIIRLFGVYNDYYTRQIIIMTKMYTISWARLGTRIMMRTIGLHFTLNILESVFSRN